MASVGNTLETAARRVLESGESVVNLQISGQLDERGTLRHFITTIFPISDEPSGSASVGCVVVDITQRKEAEDRLQESEERFRQLAEHIREVFWITNGDGTEVIYVSPAYSEIWGRPCDEVHNRSDAWIEAIHADDRDRVRANFARRAISEEFDEEYRIVQPGGSIRWIHDRGFPIKDRAGETYRIVGIAEDVTTLKEAGEELISLNRDLEHRVDQRTSKLKETNDELRVEVAERQRALAQASAYRDQLRSLVAELFLAEERERRNLAGDLHDGLGQMVALAKMKLELIRQSVESESNNEPLLEVMKLVEDIQRSVRSLTFQLSPPILHDLGFVSAVQWLADDLLERYGIQSEIECNSDCTSMNETARVILFRAVRELLINVAKHSQTSDARVFIDELDGNIEIRIEDDGVGFNIQRASASAKSGIGLFNIRERIGRLDGDMQVRSRPGQGTTVFLRVPLSLVSESQSDP